MPPRSSEEPPIAGAALRPTLVGDSGGELAFLDATGVTQF
jgi:hypothetical protein